MSEGGAAPPSAGVVERLKRVSRYAAVLAEQLEAVREDDRGRFTRLADERHTLEAWLREDSTESEGEAEIGIQERVRSEIETALADLAEHLTIERTAEERWTRINEGAVRSARGVPSLRISPREYPALEARSAKVDLRL